MRWTARRRDTRRRHIYVHGSHADRKTRDCSTCRRELRRCCASVRASARASVRARVRACARVSARASVCAILHLPGYTDMYIDHPTLHVRALSVSVRASE